MKLDSVKFTNHILIPLNMDDFRKELGWYATWYNEHRPHQSLKGRTPQDVYSGLPRSPCNVDAVDDVPQPVANSKLPTMTLAVSHLNYCRMLPLVSLRKAA